MKEKNISITTWQNNNQPQSSLHQAIWTVNNDTCLIVSQKDNIKIDISAHSVYFKMPPVSMIFIANCQTTGHLEDEALPAPMPFAINCKNIINNNNYIEIDYQIEAENFKLIIKEESL